MLRPPRRGACELYDTTIATAMYYVVETDKTFADAAAALEDAVVKNGFGVLFVHDLGNTLRNKGVEFAEESKVFEVCNPVQASRVMGNDMRLNMALPCRISVYTEKGKTKIGMIRPVDLLATLSSDQEMKKIAEEVEEKTTRMIDDAR